MTAAGPLGGAVLAGGASRRMGTDKALIALGGRPLVHRSVDALVGAGAEPVIVVGGDHQALGALGLSTVADRWPGEGPLGGIITALMALPNELVAVLSCDLLEPSPAAVAALVAAIDDADVAVPVVDERLQWLHAVWRSRSVSRIADQFASGTRAPRSVANALRVVEVAADDPRHFRDADRPEDLPRPR